MARKKKPFDDSGIRQLEAHDRWLSQPGNRDRYAGQVVIVYEGEVLGSGLDHGVAMREARRRAEEMKIPFPNWGPMVCVVVPSNLGFDPEFFIPPNGR